MAMATTYGDGSSSSNDAAMVCLKDYRERARLRLGAPTWHFVDNGACGEQTVRDNEEAYARWRLRPRVLRDITVRTMSTTLLGRPIAFPVGVAPSSLQRLVHPDGEVATAKGAAAAGTVMVLSSASSTSLEEVAEAGGEGALRWFQLYVAKDRTFTESLVRRAERSGYAALVLTVDAPYFGRRWQVLRHKSSVPPHIRYGNFPAGERPKGSINIREFADATFDPNVTWADVRWLKGLTSLPVVLKGILTGEDAELAVRYGADAILVSNHGGRQLDGVLATIDVLEEVVAAVSGRCEVYVDGGITQGTDVLKALALGARAVFVGRPVLWGLACQGERGVREVLQLLEQELDLAMALAGCCRVDDVPRSLVRRVPALESKL